MPVAFLLHRVCEEFGVLPAVAARALETDTGLIGDVLDVRAFVRAWHAQDDYEARDPRPAQAPRIPKALRDRLVKARVGRLMAMKAEEVP